MNGKQAKRVRKCVYKDLTYRFRKYGDTPTSEQISLTGQARYRLYTRRADFRRNLYQKLKKQFTRNWKQTAELMRKHDYV